MKRKIVRVISTMKNIFFNNWSFIFFIFQKYRIFQQTISKHEKKFLYVIKIIPVFVHILLFIHKTIIDQLPAYFSLTLSSFVVNKIIFSNSKKIWYLSVFSWQSYIFKLVKLFSLDSLFSLVKVCNNSKVAYLVMILIFSARHPTPPKNI